MSRRCSFRKAPTLDQFRCIEFDGPRSYRQKTPRRGEPVAREFGQPSAGVRMKRLPSVCVLLAVQVLVGLQPGIFGIPKLTSLFVGQVVAGLWAFSALRMVCRCHDRVSPSEAAADEIRV